MLSAVPHYHSYIDFISYSFLIKVVINPIFLLRALSSEFITVLVKADSYDRIEMTGYAFPVIRYSGAPKSTCEAAVKI